MTWIINLLTTSTILISFFSVKGFKDSFYNFLVAYRLSYVNLFGVLAFYLMNQMLLVFCLFRTSSRHSVSLCHPSAHQRPRQQPHTHGAQGSAIQPKAPPSGDKNSICVVNSTSDFYNLVIPR